MSPKVGLVYIMSLLILSKTINGHTMYIDSYSKPGTIIYVILINYFGCYNVMLLQFNTLCLTLHTTNLSDKTSVALANPEVYSIKSKFKMVSTANTYYIQTLDNLIFVMCSSRWYPYIMLGNMNSLSPELYHFRRQPKRQTMNRVIWIYIIWIHLWTHEEKKALSSKAPPNLHMEPQNHCLSTSDSLPLPAGPQFFSFHI